MQENQLVVFCDETTPRYVTSVCILDYDTLAIADRFGNVAIVELQNSFHRIHLILDASPKKCSRGGSGRLILVTIN